MEACCTLGDILNDPEEVLYETDNFFVTPTIGSMGIPGYLLLLSKQCYKGMGNIPESMHKELEEVTQHTKAILKEIYKKDVQIFEHGPKVCGVHGGACLDHAHLHIVPGLDIMDSLAIDLLHRLDNKGSFYRVDREDGIKRAAEIMQKGTSSYFLAESPEGKRVFVEVNFHIPSQYMRHFIAQEVGTKEWDWKVHGHFDTYEQTLQQLQGQF